MAITHKQKVASVQNTYNYSVICSLQQVVGVGITRYYKNVTVDYGSPVTDVSISNVGGPCTSQPTFSIDGTKVTYACYSSNSMDPVTFTVTVTLGGTQDIVITDIQTTSGREINYAKKRSGAYL